MAAGVEQPLDGSGDRPQVLALGAPRLDRRGLLLLDHRRHQLLWTPPLGTDRALELRAPEQGPQHRSQRGVVVQVHLGEGVDQGVAGRVGDEADGQPPAHFPGGGRVVGEVPQVPVEGVRAGVPGRVGVGEAHDPHRADVVVPRVVAVLVGLPVQAVAGQQQRRVADVVLGVVAAADGVQLEEFPAEVLVGVVGRVQLVVQVDQHAGVVHGGLEHVGELAEGVLPQDGCVVPAGEGAGLAVRSDVEVVAHGVDHRLVEVALGVDLPDRPRDAQRLAGAPGLAVTLLVDRPGGLAGPTEVLLDELVRAGVVDPGRVELALDPGVVALLRDLVRDAVGGCRADPAGQVPGQGRLQVEVVGQCRGDRRQRGRDGRQRRRGAGETGEGEAATDAETDQVPTGMELWEVLLGVVDARHRCRLGGVNRCGYLNAS